MNICGVVVFFNPSDSCISNIDSYIDHLDKIITVSYTHLTLPTILRV